MDQQAKFFKAGGEQDRRPFPWKFVGLGGAACVALALLLSYWPDLVAFEEATRPKTPRAKPSISHAELEREIQRTEGAASALSSYLDPEGRTIWSYYEAMKGFEKQRSHFAYNKPTESEWLNNEHLVVTFKVAVIGDNGSETIIESRWRANLRDLTVTPLNEDADRLKNWTTQNRPQASLPPPSLKASLKAWTLDRGGIETKLGAKVGDDENWAFEPQPYHARFNPKVDPLFVFSVEKAFTGTGEFSPDSLAKGKAFIESFAMSRLSSAETELCLRALTTAYERREPAGMGHTDGGTSGWLWGTAYRFEVVVSGAVTSEGKHRMRIEAQRYSK